MSGQQSGIVMRVKPSDRSGTKWLGPGKEGDTDFALQDGIIFGWSESNMQYESCWWLNSDGTPATGSTENAQRHIDNLCRDRPFNPEWLNA